MNKYEALYIPVDQTTQPQKNGVKCNCDVLHSFAKFLPSLCITINMASAEYI